jgi:uncharacterized membrane protein YfcA
VQLFSVALGFLIGLSLGLVGGGGSILTVPIFVYVLGFGPKESIAMSLLVVGVTSLVGAAGHWREGHVNLRVAALFGAVAMVGTFLGTRLATRLTGREQLVIFATVMLFAARFMARQHGSGIDEIESGASARPLPPALAVMEGLVVGLLTGIAGVGGGFLIVPALVWAGLPLSDAVGTSLLTIAMNCGVGLYGYIGQVPIAWTSVGLVAGGTLPGIVAGTYAMRFVSQRTLHRSFAALLLGVAAFILSSEGFALFY